jgi:hypothetical protein
MQAFSMMPRLPPTGRGRNENNLWHDEKARCLLHERDRHG